MISVKTLDGGTTSINLDDIESVDAGTIHITDTKGNGTITGESVTLRSGKQFDLAPHESGKVIRGLREAGRIK